MEALLRIWTLTGSGGDPKGNFCDDRLTPLQFKNAYFLYSTSVVRNFEDKRTLAKAGNRRDNKIKDTGQKMWTRHM